MALRSSLLLSDMETSSQPSGSVTSHASSLLTPATSVTDAVTDDGASITHESADHSMVPQDGKTRRSLRAQTNVGSYNLAHLSDLQYDNKGDRLRQERSFSGVTLVEDDLVPASPGQRRRVLEGQVAKALDLEWQVDDFDDAPRPSSNDSTISKRSSKTLDRIKSVAGRLTSSLGKRNRNNASTTARPDPQAAAVESVEVPEDDNATLAPPAKKARLLQTLADMTNSITGGVPKRKTQKKWLSQGLYCGQPSDTKGTLTDAKQKAKTTSTIGQTTQCMPYPMFSAGTRSADFQLPFDVFAPLKRQEKPKEWKKLAKNSFTPAAKEVWRTKKLEPSFCLCQPPKPGSGQEGCDENCLNRTMLYECDERNCNMPAELCTNRAFADLAGRMKKGNDFDVGVEIIKTKECGHGLRASRPFAPGQIIIEYCGEVITQEESDRRMNEVYKDKDAYYLMEFDQGMIIDATKGNITRFVNHSCAPNSVMEKRIVKGEPKMALFAGPNGVMTGEELSYDYNFDNFSSLNVLDCRCGAEYCRGKLQRRDAKKERENLAAGLKRKLLEASASASPEPTVERKLLKKRKTGRWSKGWAYVDPEMEAVRLQEDAIESGKAINARALETLKQDTSKIKTDESSIGRGSRTASINAKARLMERANSVRSLVTIKNHVQRKRKSVPITADETALLQAEIRVRVAEEEEVLPGAAAVEEEQHQQQQQKSSAKSRSRQARTKPDLLALPAMDEDLDVLEMVLNAGQASRFAAAEMA